MPATTDVHHAHDLDRGDPLAEYRDRFLGADTPLVYFDGNSLGRPLAVTPDNLATFVREDWGGRLIRGWDEQWFDQPLVLGDELGRITLGAAPGQTAIGDSTTVLLYKLARAAVDAQLARDPRRREIVVDTDNFPTDRYLVEGIAGERGLTIRWIDVDRSAGVTAEQLAAVVGPATGLVLLSHVAYRSAYVADGPGLTRIAHDAGALVLWDLSHSVGSVPLALDEWGADLATGCGYKYLNGGPGAPAFAYVATRLQAALTQPIMGWMGHAEPFLMGPGYRPAVGMRRFLSGTPAIVGMIGLRDMLALIDRAGMTAIREKSMALTAYALELADAWLVPLGVVVASPRDPARRGGHVTLTHPRMREVTARLQAQDVIPDYRDPHGLRIGLSPLSTSFTEVWRGADGGARDAPGAGVRGPGPAAPAGSLVNPHGQVVGPPVPGWTARPAPAPATLTGRLVRLEPVGPSHTDDLFAALCGPADAHRWTYRLQEMPASRSELAGLLAQAAADPASVTSAIVPLATGRAEGLATLMRCDPAHGSVEVGAIIYSAALQRTAAATEAMALLARHVFEDLGYRRYEWKCDSGNEPSRRAAARLGFEYEGRFRQAMVYKGRNRDTDWFSMTDAEWPAIASAYARWLDPGNFDGSGRQRTSLARLVSSAARTSEEDETWTSD